METDTQREDSHVTMETETEMVQLEAKGHQGLPVTPRS